MVIYVIFFNGLLFFFFKQKTAYEMRISDWSSDVCSSDLDDEHHVALGLDGAEEAGVGALPVDDAVARPQRLLDAPADVEGIARALRVDLHGVDRPGQPEEELGRLQRHVDEALVVDRNADLEKAGDAVGLHARHGAHPRGGAGRRTPRAPVSGRSEARRVGQECGSTCRSRWSRSQ